MPADSPSNLAARPEVFIVRGRRVVLPSGEAAAAIHIRAGHIAAVTAFDDVPSSATIIEAGESLVMPGIVDTHVHINEPGRTEWEGFASATRAAAAGGVTTLIEMPLNSIPATTTTAAFKQKIAAASGKLHVDVGFWGGVVPGNSNELAPLWNAGAFGFKCFLVPSGVAEFQHVTESDLRAALPHLAKFNAPLLVHAELPDPIDRAISALPSDASPRNYGTWLASRPRAAENEAIEMMLRLAREFGVRVHIVHLSSSDAIAMLKAAKHQNTKVTVETCPHYLTFESEQIREGATEYKCAPPIRERSNRDQLWTALHDGVIDFIATDHSPCPPAMKLKSQAFKQEAFGHEAIKNEVLKAKVVKNEVVKNEGDFLRAWGGIASLQLSLSAVWTEARSRGYAVSRIAEWLSAAPARLAGLEQRKGRIAPGFDADLLIWNPDAKFTVDPMKLEHRHKVTPYAGRELFGVVETTFLRGVKVFDRSAEGGTKVSEHSGQVLRRGKC
jgi:allantoinase